MMPISTVAAITPKAKAARKTVFPLSSGMFVMSRSLVRWTIAGFAVVLGACVEPTAPTRRFGVLDDVGENTWKSVSVGTDHTCGLKVDGTAFCWGSNRNFQLGIATTGFVCGAEPTQFPCVATPTPVQTDLKFSSISAGAYHTCGITVTREAYCWGMNEQGQVSDFAASAPTPTRVPGTLGWTRISAGYSHSCAVRTDGALYCWGSNDRGQLGIGSATNFGGPMRVPLNPTIASVSAGQQRTCARTTVGVIYCWGATWVERRDGLELTRVQATPLLVQNSPAMVWLSVGSFTTCAAGVSGSAYCWEANPRGEMGTGNQQGSTTPVRVASNLAFVQVSAGIVQSCGIAKSGAGYCWGDNSFGQLGVSSSLLLGRCSAQQLPCSMTPVAVFGRQRFTEISTGFGSHACGVTVNGNLYCWGLGVSGQRGDGSASNAIALPILVAEE